MPKIIKKNGYDVRVITQNGLDALVYKKRIAQVKEWNESLDSDQQIEMEPSYLKVQRSIKKAFKKCGLGPHKYFEQLLLAALSWSDDLEYRPNFSRIPLKLRLKHSDAFVLSDRETAIINLDKMRTTFEVMSGFLSIYSKSNKESAMFCDELLGDLEDALRNAEQDFVNIEKHFGSAKPLSSRDKAIHEMFSVLSGGTGVTDDKTPLGAVAGILQTMYRLEDPESKDWVSVMRAAVKRYADKDKPKRKRKEK